MAHTLHHWRYALNQTVLTWLAAEGHLTPAQIVERDRLSQKKRQKASNKVVDGMENTGVMRTLYQQFKENLAAARDAKACHYYRNKRQDSWLTSSSPNGSRAGTDNRITSQTLRESRYFIVPCDSRLVSAPATKSKNSHKQVAWSRMVQLNWIFGIWKLRNPCCTLCTCPPTLKRLWLDITLDVVEKVGADPQLERCSTLTLSSITFSLGLKHVY